MSLFMVGLDSSIVNIALPAIGQDLHASVAGLQWTVDAYALVLASLLMLSGATADRAGRRRVFQIGLATFTVGSALFSLASGLGWLIAFRMLQPSAGPCSTRWRCPSSPTCSSTKTERARAIGVWGGAYGLSLSLGPVVGGLLLDSVGWRGTFYVNIPVGLAAIALTARFVLAAMGGVVFVLGLVTTSQWALGTAARTAAMFDTGEPKPLRTATAADR